MVYSVGDNVSFSHLHILHVDTKTILTILVEYQKTCQLSRKNIVGNVSIIYLDYMFFAGAKCYKIWKGADDIL